MHSLLLLLQNAIPLPIDCKHPDLQGGRTDFPRVRNLDKEPLLHRGTGCSQGYTLTTAAFSFFFWICNLKCSLESFADIIDLDVV